MTSDVNEKIVGKREHHAIKEETNYGTAADLTSGDPIVFGRNPRFEPADEEDMIPIRGAGRDDIEVILEKAARIRRGTLFFSPQNWRWLKHVLGNGSSDVTDTDQGSYQEHTFSPNTKVSSFTYHRTFQHSNNAYAIPYVGGQVNGATLSWEAGTGEDVALMQAQMEVMFQDSNTPLTSSLPKAGSSPSTDAFQFRNVNFTFNGTVQAALRRGSINIPNNLNDARYAAYDTLNRTKASSTPQERRPNGTFVVHYEDKSYFEELTGDAVSGTNQFEFKRGTNDRLVIPFDKFYVTQVRDNTELTGVNEAQIDWIGPRLGTVKAEDQISTY